MIYFLEVLILLLALAVPISLLSDTSEIEKQQIYTKRCIELEIDEPKSCKNMAKILFNGE